MSVRATVENFTLLTGAVIVNDTWKLIVGEVYEEVYSPTCEDCLGTNGCEMLQDPGAYYLFDLSTDASESNDVSASNPTILGELMEILQREYTALDASTSWRNSDESAFDGDQIDSIAVL